MIQQVNKSRITPACLLITLAFRHKETLRVINTIIIHLTTALAVTIDIIHRTGLETNHMRKLVVYILYSAIRVWDYFMYSAISQENQY